MTRAERLHTARINEALDRGRGRSVAVDFSHVLANLPTPEVRDYRHAALVVCGHVVDEYPEEEYSEEVRLAAAGELLDALGITGEEWK